MTAEPALTVRDVAQQLQISEDTVRDLLNRGELCGYQIGRRWRVDPPQLRAFIAARTPAAPAAPRGTPVASEWGDLPPIPNEFA
jgi:excisionase family DNA binding protein